jgi:hypothetical protein
MPPYALNPLSTIYKNFINFSAAKWFYEHSIFG